MLDFILLVWKKLYFYFASCKKVDIIFTSLKKVVFLFY